MKIGLIHNQFVSRGGLEKYLYTFAGQLVSDSHEVHVITQRVDAASQALDVVLHRLPAPALPSSLRLLRFSADAAKAVAALGLDVSIGFGRTTAQDLHRAGAGCHKVYSRLLNPAKRLGIKNRVELRLEKRLYTSGRTRNFVVNSTLVGEQLQREYDVSPKRIAVIHTAVDSNYFSPVSAPHDREALREQLSPETPSGNIVYLFVSGGHRRKGLDALLAAWARVPAHAELWIVGAPLRSGYRLLIKTHNIGDRVRTYDTVDDVRPFYRAADFFIHPTLYDACANTVLQSMASGLPGIISCRDGAIDFIEEGVSGFRLENPSSPAGIAHLVEATTGLAPEDRNRIGEAARARVLPLTWRAHVDRWMEVIGRILPYSPK